MSRKSFVVSLLLTAAVAASHAFAPAAMADEATAQPKDKSMMSREQVTRILDSSRMIIPSQGVDEKVRLHINGIDQWVSIRGKDRRNPVLLFLHGGPAAPAMPESYTFQTPWEDYFTVVQWDQRGAGKTYRANTEEAMAPGMSVKGMTDDAEQVVSYLREHFGKQKIFLMGHSWGTILGVELAQRHPEWFYAYISTGQVVSGRRNEEVGFNYALGKAKEEGNQAAIREMEAMAPYPGNGPLTLDRVGTRSKWEMYYGGLAWGRKDYQFDVDAEELSPDYSREDLAAIDKGSLFSLKYLLPELLATDFSHVTHFDCPVIVYVGAHDYTTPHELAEQWFANIHAPSKKLVSFADSAHMMMQEQPGRFLAHLVSDALPLAQKVGDAAPAEVTSDH
ncbi:alpha/beta fold hydrolase [Dyella amyloliquefaciens]|uniref:alpha/beta fold hydrolase n=1 Tax=Dyella amyloliquefaciens TaxID=1770545 RepID=UPI001E55A4EB|nr:alpha/beta hydrolase [Dyella amyloliquefaciens]